MHTVAFSTPAKEGQSISLRDLRVTELVMDKVTEADLSIAIAAGTTVFREDMPIGSKEYFTTRQDEHIAPSDIPRIETMLREAATQPLMDTAVKSYKTRNYWKWCDL